ncbi:prepilin-type N-terminal cleavage/methylation domain-containing protein [Opitutaceae bacterium TAV1]|nr:prepilin-type N-terminal cleavage/methylation domain-containing protein [Opitutaceae bacterium TAV1]
MNSTRSHAFTLIELLTVIAIIGILAAILIPTVSKVRETARRAQAISKLRQAIIATMNYGNENKGRPPAPQISATGEPLFTGTPHAYSADAYDATLKPYLGNRYVAFYASEALRKYDKNYNPDEQRAIEAGGGTPKEHVHFAYFQRTTKSGNSGAPKTGYNDIFKDLLNPPMDYAIWGTLAFKTSAKTLGYAEAANGNTTPLSGMFAGYPDCSVKWYKFEQLVAYSSDNAYFWPKPKNE